MRHEIRALQTRIGQLRRGNGRRFPATLKAEIAQLTRRLRGEGVSWTELSAQLGIPAVTLRRMERDKEGPFSRVEVVETRSTAVLVTPSGFRVEGLSLDDLVAMVERLR